MLKSWKTRALAVAGVAMAAAPMVLLSSAGAVAPPGPPTVTSLSPVNGPAGQSVTVTGTGCGTAASPATSVSLFVTGPAVTTPTAVNGTLVAGSTSGDFTGTVTIPNGARAGETYSVVARCADAAGTGAPSSGGPTFTVTNAGLTGVVTGLAGTTGVTGITGITSGATSTSGTTAGTTGIVDTSTTGTTGVAVPITRQPTFTG